MILNCYGILSTLSYYRLKTTYVIFGATADVFLSVMMWFVMDEKKDMTVFIDGNRAYSVVDVVKTDHSSVNLDFNEEAFMEREQIFNSSVLSAKASLVADRMIA